MVPVHPPLHTHPAAEQSLLSSLLPAALQVALVAPLHPPLQLHPPPLTELHAVCEVFEVQVVVAEQPPPQVQPGLLHVPWVVAEQLGALHAPVQVHPVVPTVPHAAWVVAEHVGAVHPLKMQPVVLPHVAWLSPRCRSRRPGEHAASPGFQVHAAPSAWHPVFKVVAVQVEAHPPPHWQPETEVQADCETSCDAAVQVVLLGPVQPPLNWQPAFSAEHAAALAPPPSRSRRSGLEHPPDAHCGSPVGEDWHCDCVSDAELAGHVMVCVQPVPAHVQPGFVQVACVVAEQFGAAHVPVQPHCGLPPLAVLWHCTSS